MLLRLYVNNKGSCGLQNAATSLNEINGNIQIDFMPLELIFLSFLYVDQFYFFKLYINFKLYIIKTVVLLGKFQCSIVIPVQLTYFTCEL